MLELNDEDSNGICQQSLQVCSLRPSHNITNGNANAFPISNGAGSCEILRLHSGLIKVVSPSISLRTCFAEALFDRIKG
jgi:hypothetical protein